MHYYDLIMLHSVKVFVLVPVYTSTATPLPPFSIFLVAPDLQFSYHDYHATFVKIMLTRKINDL